GGCSLPPVVCCAGGRTGRDRRRSERADAVVGTPDQGGTTIDVAILERQAARITQGSRAGDRTGGRAGRGDAATRARRTVDRPRRRAGAIPLLADGAVGVD